MRHGQDIGHLRELKTIPDVFLLVVRVDWPEGLSSLSNHVQH
jgi:hypothetical protein